jgi:hypothetical protein
MLDYQSRSRTDNWPQPGTRPAAVPEADPAAATMAWPAAATIAWPAATTMARPAVAPAYACSADPVTADDPAPVKRWSRLVRLVTFACAGAGVAAAVAATLVVVFGGPTKTAEVSSLDAATAVAPAQATTTAPPTPVAVPMASPAPTAVPTTRLSAAPRLQARHSVSSSTLTPVQVSAPQPSTTTWAEPTEGQPHDDQRQQQHVTQWQPWHDTTQPAWNWYLFQPHFDRSQHRSDHDDLPSFDGRN